MSLAAAILAELDEHALDLLAERLAPRLAERMTQRSEAGEDRWLNTREAATYLGLPVSTLHKLTASREIPFEQDAPGGKCWFLRSELDAWRRGEWQRSDLRRAA